MGVSCQGKILLRDMRRSTPDLHVRTIGLEAARKRVLVFAIVVIVIIVVVIVATAAASVLLCVPHCLMGSHSRTLHQTSSSKRAGRTPLPAPNPEMEFLEKPARRQPFANPAAQLKAGRYTTPNGSAYLQAISRCTTVHHAMSSFSGRSVALTTCRLAASDWPRSAYVHSPGRLQSV